MSYPPLFGDPAAPRIDRPDDYAVGAILLSGRHRLTRPPACCEAATTSHLGTHAGDLPAAPAEPPNLDVVAGADYRRVVDRRPVGRRRVALGLPLFTCASPWCPLVSPASRWGVFVGSGSCCAHRSALTRLTWLQLQWLALPGIRRWQRTPAGDSATSSPLSGLLVDRLLADHFRQSARTRPPKGANLEGGCRVAYGGDEP